ncbi:helix-turn-helix domain-containing protein [Actinomadura violacea]|uniref:Helix-turn-helix transcriptional regulator n=1 Tax=Actinomadura violacea TaxID=2819934 RepID=A0ABS3RLP4_9ACTN|nr:helix-turn-helix transcriptional regulator [Actinomadura violacea]MBO2457268.1 helix-turn-helix transcriptional regulator [Actinomadura violacea]
MTVRANEGPADFGKELRRRRLAAGMSLARLAGRVHYSKGHLSLVERGVRAPARDLARLCDTELRAGGALAALAGGPATPGPGLGEAKGADQEAEVWLMRLSADGPSWFQPVSRRQAVAAGAASIAGIGIGRAGPAAADDTTLPELYRSMLAQYRRLGQAVAPGLVLPVLIAQTHTLRELATHAGPRTRAELLRLASRYAEYVGWLVQETGNDESALWWTRHAVELATAGGDRELTAYGLVRNAQVTLYRDDARSTIDLAKRAQAGPVSPRVLGLAAQREAQGHALAGDHAACMRCLDRAHDLLAAAAREHDAPVLGTTNVADPAEMGRGWCLHELGRPQAAAEILDAQLARVPADAVRTRIRYGMRRTLAVAASGEIDRACEQTRELLGGATTVASATIATDLRKLARTLARHPGSRAVRELAPELGTALRNTSP